MHPDDLPRCIEIYSSAIGRREAFTLVYRLRRHDGEFRWIQDDGAPRYDSAGNFLGYIGHCLDITERKQAEEGQRKIAERLSLACRAGSIGIWELDIVNNNLIWDDQMFNLYGITPDKFSGIYEAAPAVVHPEDLERTDQELQMVQRGERDFDTEFRVVWPDGTIHHIRALAQALRDASGQAIHLVGTNYDITEQKRAEAQLNEQLEELRRWYKVTLGREMRILDLKREVNELLAQAAKPPRYRSVVLENPQEGNL